MRNKNIEFGFFILSIGILFLLVNIGIINWSIMNALFEIWPAIFIAIGINIIFRNNTIVRIITWLLFIGAVVAYGYYYDSRWEVPGNSMSNNVSIEKLKETEQGEMKLSLGGTSLFVDSTDSKLVEASIPNPDIKHNVSYRNGNSLAVVKFERESFVNIVPDRRDECRVSMNDKVLWDLDIDVGAVNGTINMSELKVGKLDLDMGAGNIKLVFGNKQKRIEADIDAGASSIEVVIPAGVGARISMDGALNNTNLRDLNWSKQGEYYISPDYDTCESKIDMDVDMGVGRFMITMQ